MQRLRPQHLLVPQEIMVGPQEVVLRPRLEALLVPHKQTVPSMSTMSTEIVEASHSGQHQVPPVPQVQPAPQGPPLLPHLRLKLGGAAFTIHTFTCFAMFRRSCTSGLPDGPPPTTLTAHLLLATTSYYLQQAPIPDAVRLLRPMPNDALPDFNRPPISSRGRVASSGFAGEIFLQSFIQTCQFFT